MKHPLWLAGILFCATAPAADIVWTNTAGGNWSAAANWSPNQVPSTNDTAWITNNGTYTVTLNANVTLAGLNLGGTSGTQTLSQAANTLTLNGAGSGTASGVYSLAGGTLLGSGTLTLAGPFNWSGGYLGSSGSVLVVTAIGGMTLSGATKYFDGGTLINNGAGSWSVGQVACYNSPVFSNAPGATFDLTADGTAFTIYSGSPLLANAGTLRKTAGTGATTISVPCANSGSVQANSGTLALTLTDGSGSFTTASGATLSVSGTATLSSSSTISGAGNFTMTSGAITNNGTFNVGGTNTFTTGTAVFGGNTTIANGPLVVNGGTVIFNGSGTVTPSSLVLSSGTLQGSMPVAISGPFNWSGGTLGSAGSATMVTANGRLAIGGTTKFLYATLVNNGTGAWSAGAIYCYSPALFSNTPAATLDLTADGSPFGIGSGNPLFANAGALRKTSGTGSTTVYLPCANTGSVQVNSGTLILTLTDGTGSFSAANGTTLSVNGTATLAPGATITGAGNFTITSGLLTNHGTLTVSGTNTFKGGTAVFAGGCTLTNTLVINGGTVEFDGAGTVAPASLLLSQGTLQGSQAVTVTGPFVWSGGFLGSAGSTTVVTANGGLTMSGTPKFMYATLVNNNAATWSEGPINCYGAAQFSNTPVATLDLTADGSFLVVAGGSPSFVNAGTLRKTAGTGTTTISPPCANTGSVQANSGTLALTLTNGTGGFSVASGATFSVNGTATLAAGSSITGAGNFTVTAGSLTNNGTLNVGGTNTFSGGTAVFAGGCTFANNALVVNGGSVMLNGSGAVAPAFLSVSDGTLQGSQAVTVSGPFVWSGGMLGSAGSATVVTANGGLTMNGLGKNLYATLINNGAGVWSAGQIGCYGLALFSNAPAATLDFTADGNAIYSGAGGNGLLVNAGTLRKTAGTGTTTVSLPCANTASVQANSGTLALTLTNGTGGFSVASGATFSVNGTATLAASSSITGAGNFTVTGGLITNNGALNVSGTNTFSAGTAVFAGGCTITSTLAVNGGTVMLNGSGTVAPAFLSVSGGTLQGSQAVTVSGPFVWSGGALGSAGSATVITANGGLTMNGTLKYLSATLVNNGAGAWSAGQINCYGSALFSNTPAATLDLAADGTAIALTGGNGLLANAGALRKTAGAGTTILSLPCANAGSVQINSGILSFSDTFIQTGGQTLLNGGNLTVQTTAQFRGGTLSGSGTITGSVSNNATLSPGASPGLLAITGTYTESSGAHMQIKLGGTTPGTGHDQLSVVGAAKLAGTLDVTYWNGFTPAPGNVFTTLVCSARSGVFSAIQSPTNNLGTIYTPKAVLLETGNASPTARLVVNPVQTACRSFLVQGSATDADGTVTNISLLLDTNVLASVSGASAQVTVSYDFPEDLTFTALATDNKGAMGATNIVVSVTTLPVRVLDPIGFQTNRAFKLCMCGVESTTNRIEASDDLNSTNWIDLGVMENTNGIWRFLDRTATNSTHRYYRARQLP
jgi:hypothetical protein